MQRYRRLTPYYLILFLTFLSQKLHPTSAARRGTMSSMLLLWSSLWIWWLCCSENSTSGILPCHYRRNPLRWGSPTGCSNIGLYLVSKMWLLCPPKRNHASLKKGIYVNHLGGEKRKSYDTHEEFLNRKEKREFVTCRWRDLCVCLTDDSCWPNLYGLKGNCDF